MSTLMVNKNRCRLEIIYALQKNFYKVADNMETVLKQIMEQMDCSLEDAKTILNTTLETSNLVQNAIRLSVKKEYDL